MLRLWHTSFRGAPPDRRRSILSIIAAFLILGVLILAGVRFSAHLVGASGTPHPTVTRPAHTAIAPGPLLVVAPLALRLSCTPGRVTQFTITNNGTQLLMWSSNGADYEPPLSLSAVSGSLAPGAAEVIMLTTSQYVIPAESARLDLTSNGGTTHVLLAIGNCRLPTTPTPHP